MAMAEIGDPLADGQSHPMFTVVFTWGWTRIPRKKVMMHAIDTIIHQIVHSANSNHLRQQFSM